MKNKKYKKGVVSLYKSFQKRGIPCSSIQVAKEMYDWIMEEEDLERLTKQV